MFTEPPVYYTVTCTNILLYHVYRSNFQTITTALPDIQSTTIYIHQQQLQFDTLYNGYSYGTACWSMAL